MKDLNNIVTAEAKDFALIGNLLDEGKTVEIAAEKGPMISEMIESGFSAYLDANIELVREGKNLGTCGCGKPANVIIRAWRD